ncbi:MAG: hypothetical protein ACLQUT_04870 [Thermoleophilia bacterium]
MTTPPERQRPHPPHENDSRGSPPRLEWRRRDHRKIGAGNRRRWGRRRVLLLVLAVLLVALVPAVSSYVATMLQPSSTPLTIRSVEWVRDHHGAWLVNLVEHYYYTWTAPRPGGPTLSALPTVAADSPMPSPRHRLIIYAPPAVRPVIDPPLAGEGVWRPACAPVNGASPVLVTVFRNEPNYPRIVTYAAWIDATRVQLALYPGRYEPPRGSPRGPMEVPASQRHRLLATFNSGFKYKDGGGGFAVNGHAYTPLKPGLGTLVAYRDGRLDIIAWHSGATPPAGVVLARQNLPMIVNGGQPNPDLNTNGAEWGWTLGNAVRVWRSGVGIDKRGNLLYVAAPEQTVMSLAAALIRVGAVRALEFDINVSWPTFNYYRRPGTSPVKFLPNPQNPGIARYLTPDDRDFLAVYVRPANGNFSVPMH